MIRAVTNSEKLMRTEFRDGDGDDDTLGTTIASVKELDTDIDNTATEVVLGVMLTVIKVEFNKPPPPLLDELDVRDELDVTEGEAPIDKDDVGDAVTVIELLDVFENEDVAVILDVTVLDAEDVIVGVGEEVDVIDIVMLSL